MGLSLSQEQVDAFHSYLRELKRWSKRIGLTGFRSDEEIVLKGFLESLACSIVLPKGLPIRAIDIGPGAGFPGLPLKIAFPNLQLTLVEASRKKVSFLKHIVRTLGLQGVTCYWARAETFQEDPEHRGSYQAVFARAVASFEDQIRLALPFLGPGGVLVVQKGPRGLEELRRWGSLRADAPPGEAGGVSISRILPIRLPRLSEERYLVVVERPRCST